MKDAQTTHSKTLFFLFAAKIPFSLFRFTRFLSVTRWFFYFSLVNQWCVVCLLGFNIVHRLFDDCWSFSLFIACFLPHSSILLLSSSSYYCISTCCLATLRRSCRATIPSIHHFVFLSYAPHHLTTQVLKNWSPIRIAWLSWIFLGGIAKLQHKHSMRMSPSFIPEPTHGAECLG